MAKNYTTDILGMTGKYVAELVARHVNEFAAAFTKKTDLDPRDIVMFQETVNDHNTYRIILKTWFAKKEEVKTIKKLERVIDKLQEDLTKYKGMWHEMESEGEASILIKGHLKWIKENYFPKK